MLVLSIIVYTYRLSTLEDHIDTRGNDSISLFRSNSNTCTSSSSSYFPCSSSSSSSFSSFPSSSSSSTSSSSSSSPLSPSLSYSTHPLLHSQASRKDALCCPSEVRPHHHVVSDGVTSHEHALMYHLSLDRQSSFRLFSAAHICYNSNHNCHK